MQNFQVKGSLRDTRKRFQHISAEANDRGQNCRVELVYDEGGYSFVDYKSKPRGLKLRIALIKVLKVNDVVVGEEYSPMDSVNFQIMVEEAGRYNLKRLTKLAEELDTFVGNFAALYVKDETRAQALEGLQDELDRRTAKEAA